jgi:hypothetical protein
MLFASLVVGPIISHALRLSIGALSYTAHRLRRLLMVNNQGRLDIMEPIAKYKR